MPEASASRLRCNRAPGGILSSLAGTGTPWKSGRHSRPFLTGTPCHGRSYRVDMLDLQVWRHVLQRASSRTEGLVHAHACRCVWWPSRLSWKRQHLCFAHDIKRPFLEGYDLDSKLFQWPSSFASFHAPSKAWLPSSFGAVLGPSRLQRSASFCESIPPPRGSITGAQEGDAIAMSVAATVALCWLLHECLAEFSIVQAWLIDNRHATSQKWWFHHGPTLLPAPSCFRCLHSVQDLGAAMRYGGHRVLGCSQARLAEGHRQQILLGPSSDLACSALWSLLPEPQARGIKRAVWFTHLALSCLSRGPGSGESSILHHVLAV